MAAGTPLSGKNAKVRVGSTNVLYAVEWRVRPMADKLDFSNFEGGGFRDFIAGLVQITLSLSGWTDVGANIYEGNLDLVAGGTLSNVLLYWSGTTGPNWSLPSAFIESMEETARVEDLVRYSGEISGKGTFSYPTGNL